MQTTWFGPMYYAHYMACRNGESDPCFLHSSVLIKHSRTVEVDQPCFPACLLVHERTCRSMHHLQVTATLKTTT